MKKIIFAWIEYDIVKCIFRICCIKILHRSHHLSFCFQTPEIIEECPKTFGYALVPPKTFQKKFCFFFSSPPLKFSSILFISLTTISKEIFPKIGIWMTLLSWVLFQKEHCNNMSRIINVNKICVTLRRLFVGGQILFF